jgi:hypothetical protein
MNRITRSEFVAEFKGAEIKVDDLPRELKQALANVRAAGIDQMELAEIAGPDGKIAKESEWRALFDKIDEGDANGSPDSFELGGGGPGSRAALMKELRDEVSRNRQAATRPAAARAPRARDLEQLSRVPSEAHRAWKDLSPAQRTKTLEKMEQRYGRDFVAQFREAQAHPKTQKHLAHLNGPGVGPSEQRLRERGFQPFARGPYNEIWVHPTGEMVYKVLDRNERAAVAAKPEVRRLDDAEELGEGMRGWIAELRRLDPDSQTYAEAFTDFWVTLTLERDEVVETLRSPDLDPADRAALEKQLRVLEAVNQERKATLKASTSAPPGHTQVVFGDWFYLQPPD